MARRRADGFTQDAPEVAASTKRRIEEAALSLFASKGFEATGIREIADRVGISSSALYHYMGSKDELLIAIMTGSMRALIAAAEQVLEHAQDAPSRLAALTRMHVTFHAEDPLRSRVSDDEIRALAPAPRKQVMELRDAYEDLWADVLDEGRQKGQFAIPDGKITRLSLLEMCNGVIRWYSPSGPMSSAQVADLMADLALAMVQARKGRRLVTLTDLDCQPIDEVVTIVRKALGFEECLAAAMPNFNGSTGSSTRTGS
jgi:AcrR family transcriptional regulator